MDLQLYQVDPLNYLVDFRYVLLFLLRHLEPTHPGLQEPRVSCRVYGPERALAVYGCVVVGQRLRLIHPALANIN